MKQRLFAYPEIKSRRVPKQTAVESQTAGTTFEQRAFNALWHNRAALGLKTIWRCKNYRTDGILELESGEWILIEIKTTLGWGSFHAACGQMLMAKQTLASPILGGIILFSDFDRRWTLARNSKPWDQFYLHAAEVGNVIRLDGLQLVGNELHFGPYANAA